MSNTATVLAFDFGASSGRAIRAVYDGQNLTYEEIHRFENVPIEKDGHLCWDVETLLKEIHTAIQKAGTFDSLGFDTWGVDFGLDVYKRQGGYCLLAAGAVRRGFLPERRCIWQLPASACRLSGSYPV